MHAHTLHKHREVIEDCGYRYKYGERRKKSTALNDALNYYNYTVHVADERTVSTDHWWIILTRKNGYLN
jgi:hypothetical protein